MTKKSKIIVLVSLSVLSLSAAITILTSRINAEEAARVSATEPPDDKRWQAVAPGRIEPVSGEIKMSAAVIGPIGEVLVKANDKVFAGEPLIRIEDSEVRARRAGAEAQIALRRRARNDQSPSSRAADRRKAEDAVADDQRAIVEAHAAVDRAAEARRGGNGTDADIETAVASVKRAEDRLQQHKADLRKLEADSNTPLPSQVEGQLTAARADLAGIEAAIEKLTIRSPINATILQVNARQGELAAPSSPQPLLVLGDISALRVRAELDERDFGEIKVGQPVLVRAAAFRGRDFNGKVASIAPIVQSGKINNRDQRNLSDINVAEVLVDLSEPGPLAVGMKVDVYFRYDTPQQSQQQAQQPPPQKP